MLECGISFRVRLHIRYSTTQRQLPSSLIGYEIRQGAHHHPEGRRLRSRQRKSEQAAERDWASTPRTSRDRRRTSGLSNSCSTLGGTCGILFSLPRAAACVVLFAAPWSGTTPVVCSSVPRGNCPLRTLDRQAAVESLFAVISLNSLTLPTS